MLYVYVHNGTAVHELKKVKKRADVETKKRE